MSGRHESCRFVQLHRAPFSLQAPPPSKFGSEPLSQQKVHVRREMADEQGPMSEATDSLVDNHQSFTNPELIFGLVGPIGVDLDSVILSINRQLGEVGYNIVAIHLTDYMKHEKIKTSIDDSGYFERYESLIKIANEFRHHAQRNDALAGVAIRQIRFERKRITDDENAPALGTAYVIRQFKRPEEIELMRKTYGRKFVQVSVYGSEQERRALIFKKIKTFNLSHKEDHECETKAIALIQMDNNQKDEKNGQRISDVFQLGDVFVDGIDKDKIEKTIKRFIEALFGSNASSPNRDEYGLYVASAAALRSIDLSRQVGAAIFSEMGEVITLGCNEVPKAGGGTYWTGEGPVYRDMEMGNDPNQTRRNEIIFDLLKRMGDEGLLSQKLTQKNSIQAQVNAILETDRIKDAQLMDIIEFGRIIHAEMSAISDASRLGRATKDATLFCTTFPCHLCAKHIVAAGIIRVVFLEPYPKSYARQLHEDSITFNPKDKGKVIFEPFIGISPRRYRDIFEKRKRKNSKGRAETWYESRPIPMIEDKTSAYIQNEKGSYIVAVKGMFS